MQQSGQILPPDLDISRWTDLQIATEVVRQWMKNLVVNKEYHDERRAIVIDVPDDVISGTVTPTL